MPMTGTCLPRSAPSTCLVHLARLFTGSSMGDGTAPSSLGTCWSLPSTPGLSCRCGVPESTP
eukprot:607495-Lingulodinium_polyedra.AAC.1